MRGLWKAIGVLVAAALLVGAGFLAGLRLPDRLFPDRSYQEIGPTVVESVRSLAHLTTVEMVQYTTVEKGNDRGWLNWARGDRIFLFAVARIGAGVDLAGLDEDSFDVDTETGEVTVRLPAPQVLYVALDNEATQVYDRDTGLFTKGDPQLETDARQVAEEVLLEQALQAGILRRAEENAVLALTEFLESLGYRRVTVVTGGS